MSPSVIHIKPMIYLHEFYLNLILIKIPAFLSSIISTQNPFPKTIQVYSNYKKNTKVQYNITINLLKHQLNMLHRNNIINLLTIMLAACVLITDVGCMMEMGNYMVLKNNRVVALGVGQQDNSLWERKLWVENDQEGIKVEVPVSQRQQGSTEKYPIGKYEQFLPIFYSHLSQRGYLRPSDPFTQQQHNTRLIKGYKLLKPSYSQPQPQAQTQLKTFLHTLLTHQNLTFLNLRLQDTFSLQLTYVPESQTFRVTRYQIRYLFATMLKETLPEDVLRRVVVVEDFEGKVGSVERKLTGRGLHQGVNMTVILDDKVNIQVEEIKGKCQVQFTDILPESTYIDADQRRQYTTNYEVINVQKPAFASKQYFYKFKLPFTEFQQSSVNSYTYQQPVHFRYPSPSLLNYTKIYLHPIQTARIVCQQQGAQPKIFTLKQNALFQRGTAYIPHADVSKSRIVSITTLAVCLVAVLIILQQLKKN